MQTQKYLEECSFYPLTDEEFNNVVEFFKWLRDVRDSISRRDESNDFLFTNLESERLAS